MTHDELLARIQDEHWRLFNFHSEDQSEKAIEFRGAVLKITRERRAVVELHKPMADWRKHPIEYDVCDCCGWEKVYPCPTIQAIEKVLG